MTPAQTKEDAVHILCIDVGLDLSQNQALELYSVLQTAATCIVNKFYSIWRSSLGSNFVSWKNWIASKNIYGILGC